MNYMTKYMLNTVIKNDIQTVLTDKPEYQILASYLAEWSCIGDIKEDLLPEIESVLSGEVTSTDVDADVVGLAYIEKETTKLMGSDVGYADMELPTIEFREIIIKWLEFLENSKA